MSGWEPKNILVVTETVGHHSLTTCAQTPVKKKRSCHDGRLEMKEN